MWGMLRGPAQISPQYQRTRSCRWWESCWWRPVRRRPLGDHGKRRPRRAQSVAAPEGRPTHTDARRRSPPAGRRRLCSPHTRRAPGRGAASRLPSTPAAPLPQMQSLLRPNACLFPREPNLKQPWPPPLSAGPIRGAVNPRLIKHETDMVKIPILQKHRNSG